MLPLEPLLTSTRLDKLRQQTGSLQFKRRTLKQLADMICGNFKPEESFFPYRSSSVLTEFFQESDTDYAHDGSTRAYWVADTLAQILAEPRQPSTNALPDTFMRVIRRLMEPEDATNEGPERPGALSLLNSALKREGYEAFYAEDKQYYIRNLTTNATILSTPNPHRPFSPAEIERMEHMIDYIDKATEDELIEEVLLPLFRQLGFHRITAAGHKDKALEYGKDIWMKYILPTQHVLYFGIQVKKGKLDAAGVSKEKNINIAEVHHQALMMLGHEIFDPEIGKRVLVDHAYIIAGGEITKAARNWIGNKLDASNRSQILFMERDDILNLFVTTNAPLPGSSKENLVQPDDIPF